MNTEKYTKKELLSTIDEISLILQKITKTTEKSVRKNELEELIGSLPFLLLNDKIFEKNLDIARFADKLGINIPTPEKKKKEDIIGRIIVSVAKFDFRKISELNSIISDLVRNKNAISKNNFFNEWEDAIKNMNL